MPAVIGKCIFLILLALPVWVSAQFNTFAPQNALVVTPPYPEPGQVVSVDLDDYAGGLFGATIEWSYNGDIIPTLENQRSIEFVAGDVGTTDVIEAALTTAAGVTETLSATVNPIYLDIILEPQTRVPDWYQGRSLPSIGSVVNATALVYDGNLLNPADLVYTWRVNQQVLEAGPVRGRNVMAFNTPRGNTFLLSVTVARATGETIARETIVVNSVNPELAFYEQHPLYGPSAFPIDPNRAFIGNTLAVVAEPFHLDTRVYNNPDVAVWEINGLETDNGSRNPYEITLQRGATSGQTTVTFHVRSLREILQGVEDDLRLSF